MPIGVDHDALQYPSISYSLVGKDEEDIYHQKRLLEDFVRKNGMTNIKHFAGDGYTGNNFNHPRFQAMLAEAEAGKIGTIIIKDMSHFGRNYLEVGFYIEILFPENRNALSQCSNRQKPPPAKRGSGWSRWYERRGNLAPQWL